ncbi:hypothetical protein SBRCBS47491_008216 [Sporothrix bragantina]|uniref:Copper homeostasis protein cutC homolog n=1 Tax=Sporothrix bragantina TaxID=671064 RepID=A0ABP0CMG5_9PEZI
MSPTFEIPVFSAAAATVAVSHGATRLEINRAGSYVAGGLTPTLEEVQAIAEDVSVPLRVMIRPRGPPSGEPDFMYSDSEFQQMRRELDASVASGLLQAERGDGFVFGILKRDGPDRLSIDVDRNRQLVEAAGPYACVFHRAFDLILGDVAAEEEGPERALGTLRDCGFTGVLTAGGPGSHGAVDHAHSLQKLAMAAGAVDAKNRGIEIIVGGGLRSSNVGALAGQILAGSSKALQDAVSFHSSCLLDSAAAVAQGAEGEGVSAEEVDRISRVLASL